MKVTQAIRLFAEKQAAKLMKVADNISQVRIHLETVSKKKSDQFSNLVTYHVAVPGKDVVVKKHAVDMYEAIVDATRGAVRKLRKTQEKRMTKRRAGR